MKPSLLISCAAIVVAALAVGGVFVMRSTDGVDARNQAFAAPGLDPMTFDEARGAFYLLTPALLLVVYDAFGRTGEDEIYGTLEGVAGGDALEELYLERVGAMAGGGLEEADQTIHEIKLLNSTVSDGQGALTIDAVWQVIGTVGHAEHLHVRGNTYNALLTVAPVETAWKITDFELLDVDRETAGETFLAPQTN